MKYETDSQTHWQTTKILSKKASTYHVNGSLLTEGGQRVNCLYRNPSNLTEYIFKILHKLGKLLLIR